MESLTKLRAKRTNIKGQITQFVKFVREHGEDRKEQLPDRLRRAEDLYNFYNEVQSQIPKLKLESMIGRNPPPTQEEMQMLQTDLVRERQSVEENYFEYLAITKRLLEAKAASSIAYPQEQQVNNLFCQITNASVSKIQWQL